MVTTEIAVPGAAFITLNRPDKRNAFDWEMLKAFHAAIDELEGRRDVRVAIVRSAVERIFVAGGDIAVMRDLTVAEGSRFVYAGHALMRRIEETPLVFIACVGGFALGGGTELPLACDCVVAGESAVFGLPETTIGVIPGAGGTQRAIGIIGKSLAMEMILAGRRLSAQEAAAHGLVSRVVAPDALLDEARRIAGEIAKRSSVAIRLARDAVNMALETGLTAGIEIERRAIGLAFASEDAREGFTAFVEKRPPEFKGR